MRKSKKASEQKMLPKYGQARWHQAMFLPLSCLETITKSQRLFLSLHLFIFFHAFNLCKSPIELIFIGMAWLVCLIDRTHDTRREMIFNDF